MWDIHRAQRCSVFALKTAALGVNSRVDEPLGIIFKLKTTSQATNFIQYNKTFLVYGGISFVITELNLFSLMAGG
jgi:hypothetical protein